MIIRPRFIWLLLPRGIAIGRTSLRKSHPRDRVRILRMNAGGTSLRKGEEDGSTSGLARRTENDPIITVCLHNDTPFKSGESERKRERATPKTNQTGRDGIRGPPGATTDGFTLVHIERPSRRRDRGANCATIWFTSSERKTAPLVKGRGGGRRSCVDTLL